MQWKQWELNYDDRICTIKQSIILIEKNFRILNRTRLHQTVWGIKTFFNIKTKTYFLKLSYIGTQEKSGHLNLLLKKTLAQFGWQPIFGVCQCTISKNFTGNVLLHHIASYLGINKTTQHYKRCARKVFWVWIEVRNDTRYFDALMIPWWPWWYGDTNLPLVSICLPNLQMMVLIKKQFRPITVQAVWKFRGLFMDVDCR